MDDDSSRYDTHGAGASGVALWRYVLPVAVLVVVVAIVSALVLTGVVSGDKERSDVRPPMTTTPTIEIAP